jgi:hypothetical protein
MKRECSVRSARETYVGREAPRKRGGVGKLELATNEKNMGAAVEKSWRFSLSKG